MDLLLAVTEMAMGVPDAAHRRSTAHPAPPASLSSWPFRHLPTWYSFSLMYFFLLSHPASPAFAPCNPTDTMSQYSSYSAARSDSASFHSFATAASYRSSVSHYQRPGQVSYNRAPIAIAPNRQTQPGPSARPSPSPSQDPPAPQSQPQPPAGVPSHLSDTSDMISLPATPLDSLKSSDAPECDGDAGGNSGTGDGRGIENSRAVNEEGRRVEVSFRDSYETDATSDSYAEEARNTLSKGEGGAGEVVPGAGGTQEGQALLTAHAITALEEKRREGGEEEVSPTMGGAGGGGGHERFEGTRAVGQQQGVDSTGSVDNSSHSGNAVEGAVGREGLGEQPIDAAAPARDVVVGVGSTVGGGGAGDAGFGQSQAGPQGQASSPATAGAATEVDAAAAETLSPSAGALPAPASATLRNAAQKAQAGGRQRHIRPLLSARTRVPAGSPDSGNESSGDDAQQQQQQQQGGEQDGTAADASGGGAAPVLSPRRGVSARKPTASPSAATASASRSTAAAGGAGGSTGSASANGKAGSSSPGSSSSSGVKGRPAWGQAAPRSKSMPSSPRSNSPRSTTTAAGTPAAAAGSGGAKPSSPRRPSTSSSSPDSAKTLNPAWRSGAGKPAAGGGAGLSPRPARSSSLPAAPGSKVNSADATGSGKALNPAPQASQQQPRSVSGTGSSSSTPPQRSPSGSPHKPRATSQSRPARSPVSRQSSANARLLGDVAKQQGRGTAAAAAAGSQAKTAGAPRNGDILPAGRAGLATAAAAAAAVVAEEAAAGAGVPEAVEASAGDVHPDSNGALSHAAASPESSAANVLQVDLPGRFPSPGNSSVVSNISSYTPENNAYATDGYISTPDNGQSSSHVTGGDGEEDMAGSVAGSSAPGGTEWAAVKGGEERERERGGRDEPRPGTLKRWQSLQPMEAQSSRNRGMSGESHPPPPSPTPGSSGDIAVAQAEAGGYQPQSGA